jgi:protein phosphatase
MIDAGTAAPESDQERSKRHVLTNWVGGGVVEVDVEQHRLSDGDRLLLCTDGLTNLVSDAEIAAVLSGHPRDADSCRALVDRALQHGGFDNVTVVLASYSIPAAADTADWAAPPG